MGLWPVGDPLPVRLGSQAPDITCLHEQRPQSHQQLLQEQELEHDGRCSMPAGQQASILASICEGFRKPKGSDL